MCNKNRICSFLIGCIAVLIGTLLYNGVDFVRLKSASPAFVTTNIVRPEDFPDLTGKVVIVTGANVGLGKSSTKLLANQGATVVMACRNMDKCQKAKAEISKEVLEKNLYTDSNISTKLFSKSNLKPMNLNLASFKSIRNFANEFTKKYNRLDSLLLNAGVAHTQFFLTADLIEGQMGINHFGHFLLTKLLRPMLEETEPSTVVVVSSGSHRASYREGVKTKMFDVNDPVAYDPVLGYGQSKLANILFAQELADQMESSGKSVFVNSVHPGFVHTAIARYKPVWMQQVIKGVRSYLGFESDDAALLQVYLCISPDIPKQKIARKYFIPMGEVEEPHFHAFNMTLQKKLWEVSERVTNYDAL